VKTYVHLAHEVGNTPLVRIGLPGDRIRAEVLAKIESFNPTGSVKDRVALAMIRAAEESGKILAGSTIVEASSGNTGVAVAHLAAARGYPAVIVMPDSASVAKTREIRALGAEVVHTPALFGTRRACAQAYRIAERIPHALVLDQSRNPMNSAIHAETTGPEIWEATGGRADVFVAGVGTGGTITGVAEYLRARRPDVEVVAVEPSASAVLSGGTPGPHRLIGIGAGYVPEVLRRELISRVETVTEEEADATRTRLARQTGIYGGPSSGAAAHVALRLARSESYAGKVIVTVFPDSGDRY
jgi:cysteine synthase A